MKKNEQKVENPSKGGTKKCKLKALSMCDIEDRSARKNCPLAIGKDGCAKEVPCKRTLIENGFM